MSVLLLVAAVWVVVALHFAVTLVIPLGGFAVWRWPRLFWTHMALLVWAISIPLLQPPCPLTDLEKALRRDAGLTVYQTHFIDHYFYSWLEPYPWLFEAFMGVTPLATYAHLARRRTRRRAAASPA